MKGLLPRIPSAARKLFRLVQESARLLSKAAALQATGALRSDKLIIFLVPGDEFLSGGILSIFSLYRLSAEMTAIHEAKVLVCFYPGEGWDTAGYRMFDNNVTIYPFAMVQAACRGVRQLLLHVPEYAAPQVMERIGWERLAELRRTRGLRINILNQNNLFMAGDEFLERLRRTLPETTCTTAHPSYTTPALRRAWGLPTHFLPAWTAPDDCPATAFEAKRDLMLISPDPSAYREAVLQKLASELPGLETRVISAMRYQDYLELERTAKWSLTFGEGLDGYFIGVFLRGGVGFAVYNEDFFSPEHRGLRTIYPDYDTLLARIIEDIRSLDNKADFEACNASVRPILSATWSPARTRAALEEYYRGHYTLP
ncbi:MAG: hypothetical protein M3463_03435 [Verrucomicrobiota bacterium]|nr:hypothetical protein [Verrucomicrobiota bacterium]